MTGQGPARGEDPRSPSFRLAAFAPLHPSAELCGIESRRADSRRMFATVGGILGLRPLKNP